MGVCGTVVRWDVPLFFVEVMVCDFHTGYVPNDASCHKEEVCVGFSVYVRHTLRCEYFGGPERTVLRTHERGHGRHSEPNWRNGRCLVSLESPGPALSNPTNGWSRSPRNWTRSQSDGAKDVQREIVVGNSGHIP